MVCYCIENGVKSSLMKNISYVWSGLIISSARGIKNTKIVAYRPQAIATIMNAVFAEGE